MPPQREPPSFALESWYSDSADHRCPHDAWLESLEIVEPAAGSRDKSQQTSIKLTLFGAYHDGWIVFTYTGVRSHSVAAYSCDQGPGDWLRDEYAASEAGLICHRITWACPDGGTSQWLIEAAGITYEWQPKPI